VKHKRLWLLLIIAAAVGLFFAFGLHEQLTFANLKARQAELTGYTRAHPFIAGGAYFLLYVAVTALSIPGATLMTLAGGGVFGLAWGTVLVSFASTVGATLAMLAARFLFRETVQRRFGARLRAVDEGIRREGLLYLFTLRLVPIIPFFVVNAVIGLTAMRAVSFALVSQVGMLPATVVYVNAGTQLAQLDSASGILSPGLLIAFTLLGLLPLAARWITGVVRRRLRLRGFKRPRRFEYNLVVIGGGSAGLVCAYIAAAAKAKVALVERHRMGGDCLNTGCVPSKALLASAALAARVRRAADYGVQARLHGVDFAAVMERVQKVITHVEPHDSVERYTGLGVECLAGEARITSPWTVEIDGRAISARNIVIATGARPSVPDIPGLAALDYLTSDTVWSLREAPRRLLVLGTGPIGCELAQAFARLGTQVVLVGRAARVLPREDAEAGELLAASLRADGIDLRTGQHALAFEPVGGETVVRLQAADGGVESSVAFDRVLLALGRTPVTDGLGLANAGVECDANGVVRTDATLRTTCPTIYACGDVSGGHQFTHVASHEAWYATVNALAGPFRQFRADYSVIPWVTFTDPEIARVGLNEDQARQQGVDCEVTRYGMDDLDRAIAEGEARGFVKVLTARGTDRILGATIAGPHAADLLAEFTLAMRHRIGLKKLLGTIHVYPTFSEAARYTAGAWRRAHTAPWTLRLAERFNTWRRGA